MSGDYQLVAEILVNLDAQKRAEILAAMSTNNAAKIMKIMERL
jgi:flagellar motility protein MotE (MotC chaperone)